MKRFFALALALIILSLTLVSCGGPDMTEITDISAYSKTDEKTDLVRFDVKDYGSFVIRLYPDIAPITVENFKNLVSESYYDGLYFHRVVRDFVIQTGDPTATGMGGSKDEITGEFASNGIKNDLAHAHGIVSMARRGNDNDSASSQFFVCLSDNSSVQNLDGDYAAFGYVVYGLDVVDAIGGVTVNNITQRPLVNVIIESAYFIK